MGGSFVFTFVLDGTKEIDGGWRKGGIDSRLLLLLRFSLMELFSCMQIRFFLNEYKSILSLI